MYNLIYDRNKIEDYILYYKEKKKNNSDMIACPLYEPFYSFSEGKCMRCPKDKLQFNLNQGECMLCPETTTYSSY